MRVNPGDAWENPFGRNEYFLGALIGGIFARKDAKKAAKLAAEAAKVPQVTTSEHKVDLLAMNAAAIEAGYNPQTLLNAGGLSAFTKTTQTTTGHNAMAAAQAAGAVPSMGSVFAGALGSTLDDLTASTFKAMAPMSTSYFPPAPSQGMAKAMGWTDVISGTAGGGKSGGGGARVLATSALSKNAGAPVTPTIETPTVTNPHNRYGVDPTIRDADAFSARYGEPGEWASAPWIVYNDTMYNLTGTTNAERNSNPNAVGDQMGKNLVTDFKNLGSNPIVAKIITQGLPSVMNWFGSRQPVPGGGFRTSATGGR